MVPCKNFGLRSSVDVMINREMKMKLAHTFRARKIDTPKYFHCQYYDLANQYRQDFGCRDLDEDIAFPPDISRFQR